MKNRKYAGHGKQPDVRRPAGMAKSCRTGEAAHARYDGRKKPAAESGTGKDE